MNKKAKEESLAKKILLKALESTFDLFETMEDIRHYQTAYAKGGREYIAYIKQRQEQYRLRQELLRLKKKKLIEEKKNGQQVVLCLTKNGREAALRYKILKQKSSLKNEYIMVVFDIPESERKIRNFFRGFLKESGFKQLQQSVWITQKDVFCELEELVKSFGNSKWVYLIKASYISKR